MISWLKKIGIGLSEEEKNKRRLKTLLIEMLALAKKRDLDGVQKIHHKSFQPLFNETFGTENLGEKFEEYKHYDLARNNIINSFISDLSEKQKQEFLERAQQYIDLL